MTAATLLLVTLSTQGFWFGGDTGEVRFSLNVDAAADVIVAWELKIDQLLLADGQVRIAQGGAEAKLTLETPTVRVKTPLTLHYIARKLDGTQLSEDTTTIMLYPKDLLAGVSAGAGRRILLIADADDPLAEVLTAAGVEYDRRDHLPAVRARADEVIVIGPRHAPLSGFAQGQVLELARSGAGVVMLQDQKSGRSFGMQLIEHDDAEMLRWRAEHAMLAGLEAKDWQTLVAAAPAPLRAYRFPTGQRVDAAAYWPQSQGQSDVLIGSGIFDRGRLVICQAPIDSWDRDPRAQILFANILRYLRSELKPRLRDATLAKGGAS